MIFLHRLEPSPFISCVECLMWNKALLYRNFCVRNIIVVFSIPDLYIMIRIHLLAANVLLAKTQTQ